MPATPEEKLAAANAIIDAQHALDAALAAGATKFDDRDVFYDTNPDGTLKFLLVWDGTHMTAKIDPIRVARP